MKSLARSYTHTIAIILIQELINIYYIALKSDYYNAPSQSSSSLPKMNEQKASRGKKLEKTSS